MIRVTAEDIKKIFHWVLAVGLLLLLAWIFHAFPTLSSLFNRAVRYGFLFLTALSLKALALWSIWSFVKDHKRESAIRAGFGFAAGVIVGLLAGLWIEHPDSVDVWLGQVPLGTMYLGSLVFGVGISELATFTHRSGHPLLVFICSATGAILFQLMTLPWSSFQTSWMLVFLLGAAFDQMFRYTSRAEA